MLMTNGNLPLTDAQKRSLIDFVATARRSSARTARR